MPRSRVDSRTIAVLIFTKPDGSVLCSREHTADHDIVPDDTVIFYSSQNSFSIALPSKPRSLKVALRLKFPIKILYVILSNLCYMLHIPSLLDWLLLSSFDKKTELLPPAFQ